MKAMAVFCLKAGGGSKSQQGRYLGWVGLLRRREEQEGSEEFALLPSSCSTYSL